MTIHHIFMGQLTNAESVVYPVYGQYVLVQFSKAGTYTAGTVTVEGRVNSGHSWIILATFNESTEAADCALLVARFPEMRGVLASIAGTGAAASLALVETDHPKP